MKLRQLFQTVCILCTFCSLSPVFAQQDCQGDITFNTTGTYGIVVPPGVTSLYITGVGADGGNVLNRGTDNIPPQTSFGGNGATIAGLFLVNPGDSLTIIVGESGMGENRDDSFSGAGGGGGSAVVNNTDSTLLLVAAAGGGAAEGNRMGGGGRDTTGCNPMGGAAVGGRDGAGGGGGFNSSGENGDDGDGGDGGGAGTLISGAAAGGISNIDGGAGFGGGGSSSDDRNEGGGGGGYGGGNSGNNSGGQGGCSFNSGTDQVNIAGFDGGAASAPADGSVAICFIQGPPAIPTMSQWAFLLFGLLVFTLFVTVLYNMQKAGAFLRK